MARKVSTSRARKQLGQELRAARRAHRWTMAKLASEAGVSTETLVALEHADRTGRAVRMEVIVKLARAMERPDDTLQRWLTLAGHSGLRHDRLDGVLEKLSKTYPGQFTPPPGDPIAYLRGLVRRIVPDATLMCLSCTSTPAELRRDDLRQALARCIKTWMWLALSCPYPRSAPRAAMTKLATHYSQVREAVMQLAQMLRAEAGRSHVRQVAVFVPATDTSLAPPLLLAEYRPAWVHFADKPENDELGILLRLGFNAVDRWLLLSPRNRGPHHAVAQSATLAIDTWGEYFSGIVRAWQPDSDAGWSTPSGQGEWNRQG